METVGRRAASEGLLLPAVVVILNTKQNQRGIKVRGEHEREGKGGGGGSGSFARGESGGH